jgi:dTDP-4-amino-4,6-dideoxygalactose transaminase
MNLLHYYFIWDLLFFDFIGVEYLITNNPFTMAILVALSTLGIKAGDKVIASPMACLESTTVLTMFWWPI